MDYCPPQQAPKSEMVFYTRQCYDESEDDSECIREVYEEYARLIGPLNQAFFTVLLELRRYPENNGALDLLENILSLREQTIEFFGLEQADRSMVPKGPWPPSKID